MAIIIETSKPKLLLDAIYAAIDSESIVTWEYDAKGDLTHTTPQWNKKAWFRPVIEPDELRFAMIGLEKDGIKKNVYAMYHGHLVYTLLYHFDTQFTNVMSSALLTSDDHPKQYK